MSSEVPCFDGGGHKIRGPVQLGPMRNCHMRPLSPLDGMMDTLWTCVTYIRINQYAGY